MSKNIFINSIIFYIFLLFSIPLFSDDMIPVTITINSQDSLPLEDANIRIGDLVIKTDNTGKATTSLFPANYELSISKANYFEKTFSLDISSEKSSFIFTLDSKVTTMNIKVVDALTGFPVLTSVKITNSANQSSFSSPNSSGDLNVSLEKNANYLFEVEEKNYKRFEFKLDTSKLLSSSFLFKLERLTSEVNFNFNTLEGSIILKLSETGSIYKEYSFTNGNLKLSIPFAKYDIIIKNPFYKQSELSLNLDTPTSSFTFNLIPNFNTFYFTAISSDINDIKFYDTPTSNDRDTILKNVSINFYKNKELIKSLNFDKKELKAELFYDSYDVEIKSSSTDTALFKIDLKDTTSQHIQFNIKQILSTVSGTLKLDNSFLGAVTVLFRDSDNNEYSAASGLDGTYSIKLPAKNYIVKILKDGYRIKENKEIILSSLKPNEVSSLNIELEEVPSLVVGRITTLDGKPVANAKITFRMEKEEVVTFTKEDGSYTSSVRSGLVSIRVEKSGYKSRGTVKSINKFSTLTGVDFKLEQMLSSIDGIITNGVIPIKNIIVKLLDTNKTVVSKAISKESGSFIFENLPIFSEYIISIEDLGYFPYNSQPMPLNMEPIKNFNILLKKNTFSLILEVKNPDLNPASNVEILFNNKPIKTDINGIAEYESQVALSGKTILKIEILENNYSETIEVDSKTISPIKKEVVLKNNLNSTTN